MRGRGRRRQDRRGRPAPGWRSPLAWLLCPARAAISAPDVAGGGAVRARPSCGSSRVLLYARPEPVEADPAFGGHLLVADTLAVCFVGLASHSPFRASIPSCLYPEYLAAIPSPCPAFPVPCASIQPSSVLPLVSLPPSS